MSPATNIREKGIKVSDQTIDVSTPEGRLTAYTKMRGSLDGKDVAWWYRGVQYGVVDMRPQRLWTVQGLQVTSFSSRPDGSYENRFRDIMFYLDTNTGERLDTVLNPYTGNMVRPGVQRMGPVFLIYSRAGAAIKDKENVPPGLDTDWRVDRALISGDDLILHEEGYSRVTGGPLPVVINDFITMYGSLSEACDSSRVNIAARYNYTSMLTFV